jgi:hypothetical protein
MKLGHLHKEAQLKLGHLHREAQLKLGHLHREAQLELGHLHREAQLKPRPLGQVAQKAIRLPNQCNGLKKSLQIKAFADSMKALSTIHAFSANRCRNGRIH